MAGKTTKLENVKQAYKRNQREIAAMIKIIKKRLVEHSDDEIHFGHVGDLGYVKEQLGIIDQFLANEDSLNKPAVTSEAGGWPLTAKGKTLCLTIP
jgi:hypothetical protein